MDTMDSEFLQRLLGMFKIEAREHLNEISSQLTALRAEKDGDRTALVEIAYREAHSLKGAARSVNRTDIVTLCQGMENVFAALKRGRIASSELFDLLHQTVDSCYRLIDGDDIPAGEKAAIRRLVDRLDGSLAYEAEAARSTQKEPEIIAIRPDDRDNPLYCADPLQGAVTASPPPPPHFADPAEDSPPRVAPASSSPSISPNPAAPETVRMSTSVLDTLLLQAEEMISVKLAASQRAAELRDLKKMFDLWKKERRRQGFDPAPDRSFSPLETKLTAMVRAADYDGRVAGTMIDKLLDDMKKTLMLPFSSLLELFPRFVRDLARSSGKKVELVTTGGDIEIDRRILEEMKDPLIHLIRNCVDHGIETPKERQEKGKPPDGNMRIAVASKDNKIEITVADDGRGIDVTKIKASAMRHGLIDKDMAEKLGEQEGLQLIFYSGVTTSPLITDISGRGLGLAIVREKVTKLNGTIEVETKPDAGVTFRMVVPLTLVTFRGTLVRLTEQLFVLPSVSVLRVARVRREEIETVENRETILFDGRPISLVRLDETLDLTGRVARQHNEPWVQVAILGLAEGRMAFVVDEILREQEVLVKPLGMQLSRVRNISGATVLGNGKVAPILNVSDLLKSATNIGSSVATIADEMPKSSSVLVVEDSITARTLLKNILESAGYEVQTAVDGLDGLTALKGKSYDIVVSDVEMPRMNGFDLTERIRADKKLSELPVVLVTALESREDRERGIDVGANAYIVKSSFDQSNLLEVIGRLI